MDEDMLPGWYEDPSGRPGQFRYWDGDRWTQMTQGQATQGATPSSGNTLKIIKELLLTVLLLVPAAVGMAFTAVSWGVIAAIVFAVFGGEIAGMNFWDFLWWSLNAAVLLAFIYKGVLNPVWTLYKNYALKKGFRENVTSVNEQETRERKRQLNYATRFLNAVTISWIASSLTTAAVAFLLHDLMTLAIGALWVDLLALGIMIIGGIFLRALFSAPFLFRLEKEDPVIFTKMWELWSGKQ
jgi:hypothetical protein